jgi:transcriptional regulator with XRE-family HTH domain
MPRPTKDPDLTTFVGRFGAELRRRRERKKLSVEETAAAAGVPAPTWYAWESGRYAPGLDKLPAIAAALSCSARQLIP